MPVALRPAPPSPAVLAPPVFHFPPLPASCSIVDEGTELTVENLVFTRGYTDYGGAAFQLVDFATLTANGCAFVDNEAAAWGGAISAGYANINSVGSTFEGNTAPKGGAISASDSELTMSETVFKSNSAESGGALDLTDSSVGEFDECTFEDNVASGDGGAVSASNAAVFRFTGGSLLNNQAEESAGAVVATGASTVELSGTNVLGNSAKANGACLRVTPRLHSSRASQRFNPSQHPPTLLLHYPFQVARS